MKRHALWGVFDQGFQSLINLLIGVMLIRYAEKNDYGLYGVGFAIIQLIIGFSNALIMTQMTVNMHGREKSDRDAYCGSMCIFLFLYCSFIGLVIYFASLLPFLYAYEGLLTVLSISIYGYVFMEFIRRYYYLNNTPFSAFSGTLLLMLCLVLIMSYLFYSDYIEDLHLKAFKAYAISGFMISSVAILGFIRFPWLKAFIEFKKSVVESFSNGVWACGGVLVTAIQNQGWIYLIASMQGISVIAEANAARLFLSPVGILSTSFNRVFMPRVAELNSVYGRSKAVSFAIKIMLVLLVLVIVYSSLLLVLLDWMVSVFMTAEYQSLHLLVAIWVGYYLSQSIRSTPSQLLQVFHRFKFITMANSMTAVLWFGTSLWVVKMYGIYGIIVSMTVAEIVLSMILWLKINSARLYES
jgi:O-antigen/teichoic acid export membrane protein